MSEPITRREAVGCAVGIIGGLAWPGLIAAAGPASQPGGALGKDPSSLYDDHSDLLVYIDAEGRKRPVRTPADWKRRREHILANMQKVMGPLPDLSERVPLDMQVLGEERLEKCTRKKITFVPEKGDRLLAYLMIPHDLKGKAPAMLCLHPTRPLGKAELVGLGNRKPNANYGIELAERGFVTLSPDYPNFGDYKFDPYANGYVSATMKGIVNHIRAVDLLCSLPEVDAEHIGAIGHSLGGHNALFVAVFDERIKIAVTSCGFTSFPKYYGGNLTGWSHKGYMPRIEQVYGKDPQRMPFDFPEVLAAIAPRAVFINAPVGDDNFEISGVKDCVRAAEPVFKLLKAPGPVAVHPDATHDFPENIRERAYRFVEQVLRSQ
ncbi:MAG TPA: alpha/beta fold hydrolase [Phycisphaerae bacterium]|mgnify:CR=1 FL=1|jgi:dienelactone hydrolase|nr:alpha/beta fold hydrolase [Phycisphaerae bacterium]HOJ54685.1 alpha/beta fold hydrolase [Phycisphaerae bacterium]HOL25965.1 alpha/beta fold hydrolase [Phycisphaerae bacterium]HPP19463.1 alpha/beta fold hydrolase [Phycisphaerae bacterium]HPU33961.1 alpha/beta fold hydrolase [Phycisphaerae bacterium]